MADDRKIKEAGAHIKRASQRLIAASGQPTWEAARTLLIAVATELRRAGDELEG